MPVARLAGPAAVAAVLLSSASAQAQTDPSDPSNIGDERFFVFQPADDKDITAWSGSFTSSSFFYGERASGEDPLITPDPGGVTIPAEVDSPRSRLFTDLRMRVDANHIKGSYWDMRADVRARLVPNDQTQSGTFSGEEYDFRELFFGRDGERYDVFVGRQFAYNLAAVKFDGVKVEYEKNARWRYQGFAGLYPVRGSRSVTTDYPTAEPELGMEGDGRVLPATAGVGAAYRYEKLYGSFGLVGIVPLTESQDTGETETQRIFVTSSGYYRRSRQLDIYHFLVLDGTGADGAALTNGTLGVSYTPAPNLRVHGTLTHIDTETLDVQAQTRLENPQGAPNGNVVLNNVEVARLSQDEARLEVSGSFVRRRFEVSAIGSMRRRPDVTLVTVDEMTEDVVLPSAQAADLTLRLLDRQSLYDSRIGFTYSRAFGLGDQNVNRSDFQVFNLNLQRDFQDGKSSLEGSATLILSDDDNPTDGCAAGTLDPLSCYGTSEATTFNVGLMGTYRIKRDWLGILSTQVGTQSISVLDAMQERLDLPRILTFSAFLRVAYRF